MKLGIEGRFALVTGGSKGIGQAIARALAEEGARVAITARGTEALRKAAADLEGFGVVAVPADATSQEAANAAVARTFEAFGGLDILVNNVGGAGIVFNASGLKRGQSVAVFGTGGIGLCAVMAAASLGAAPIIAIDVNPDKLAKARELGATHTLTAGEDDLVPAIRSLTGGKGVDVAIESAGRAEAMESAFESVAAGGELCIVAGNPPHGQVMRINPFSLIGGKRIAGTWGGESRPDTDIPRYVEMFADGRLPLRKLGMDEYPLDEINRALDDLEAGRVVRAMIRMGAGRQP